MGFSIDIISDIMKFPSPLYPKYKHFINMGLRYDVPPLAQSFTLSIKLPKELNYELQYIEIDQNGWKDGDSWTFCINNKVIFQNVYVKELGQRINIRPVIKLTSCNDEILFTINNKTGTSRVLFVDFGLACNKSPTDKISNLEYTLI